VRGRPFLHIAREPLEVGHRADDLARLSCLDDVAAFGTPALRGRGPGPPPGKTMNPRRSISD